MFWVSWELFCRKKKENSERNSERKFLEGIESIRIISNNKTPLNTYAQIEQ